MSLPFIGTNGCPKEEGCKDRNEFYHCYEAYAYLCDTPGHWIREDCQKLCGLGECPPRPCVDEDTSGWCDDTEKWRCNDDQYMKRVCRKLCGVCKEE